MTKFIRLPKKPDPFAAEIQSRLAAKRAGKALVTPAETRAAKSASYVTPTRLYATAAFIRAESVVALDLEAC